MKWRKITCLFTIMISGVALASCGGSSQGETSNLITTSNLNASGNGENANSALAGTDAALVSGENLAVYNNFKSSSTDIEEIMEQVVDFADSATICVQNYQTVYQTQFTGRGWQTTTTHTLYGWGSGVIYYKALLTDGSYLYKVITNEHVVAGDTSCVSGEEEYQIYDEKYDTNLSATLLGSNEDNDIAVLSFVSDRDYNAASFESDENIKKGSYVVAMGTPIDLAYYNTASFGQISKITSSTVQHGATINSGNSGGPLFSLNGNLIGINNAKLSGKTSSGSTIEGIFFAIPKQIVIESVNGIVGENEL